jgi:hypothetical protein
MISAVSSLIRPCSEWRSFSSYHPQFNPFSRSIYLAYSFDIGLSDTALPSRYSWQRTLASIATRVRNLGFTFGITYLEAAR